jgi:hypothetical protein
MKPYVMFAALSLFALTAHAELHKWVDAEGKVHYSDTIPPEVSKAQVVPKVTGKGQAEAPVQYSPKSYAERDAELRKSKQEKAETAEKKAQKEADTETRKRNCVAAQQNLRALEEGARIFNYDANGERVYLDDAAREQRLNEVRKNISSNCD